MGEEALSYFCSGERRRRWFCAHEQKENATANKYIWEHLVVIAASPNTISRPLAGVSAIQWGMYLSSFLL